jgi:magnesium-transporting ATPase (P-type)
MIERTIMSFINRWKGKNMKRLYISIIITILCFLFLGCFTLTKNNLKDYNTRIEELRFSRQVMPDFNDLPAYENINYQYRRTTTFPLFCYAETMLLVVTYDEKTYWIEKSKINNLDYLNEAIFTIGTVGSFTNKVYYELPEPEFQINSFNFRVLEASKTNGFIYPYYMGIIATSDEKNSIAYLYYHDDDKVFDCISVNKTENIMAKFIKKYFKYRW